MGGCESWLIKIIVLGNVADLSYFNFKLIYWFQEIVSTSNIDFYKTKNISSEFLVLIIYNLSSLSKIDRTQPYYKKNALSSIITISDRCLSAF